ncbi:MAG: hypothetical protein Q9169_003465 [Polycauliona sp. 2 TL-2023]
MDPTDCSWVLDTGRAVTSKGINVPFTQGGPKLLRIDLTNDTIFQTILFPPTVAYSDSYLNDSWRHLDGITEVQAERGSVPLIWGVVYGLPPGPGQPITFAGNSGADGISLSADGETLFWAAMGSRMLYLIPTERLRDRIMTNEIQAQASVVSRGEKGNGLIYLGIFEDNAANVFNPANGTVQVFARDPRIGWTDTFTVGKDSYVYFTENQL